ncbi:MAG: hypothetical protein J1F33_05325 [Clostridiales bacterium]|nr:hypothetical protein [Clostridiales bacterium]
MININDFDLKNYDYNDEDISLITDFIYGFNHGCDIRFWYEDTEYFICYVGDGTDKVLVATVKDESLRLLFNNPKDFFLSFTLDSKSFFELVSEIETYNI